jgi:hypothetical protein
MEKQVSEGSLHKWFKGSKSKDGKGGWVNVVTGGTCASDEPGEGTPKCVSSAKRASMTKAERLSAARRKKKADPNQQQKSGAAKPTYVSTDKPKKKKMKESYTRSLTPLTEKAKKCWPGYEKKGTKKMFGKTYNNCVKKEEVELEGYSANPAQQAAIAIAKKKKKEDDMVAKKKKQKMYAGYEPQGEVIDEKNKYDDSFIEGETGSKRARRDTTSAMNRSGMGYAKIGREQKERGERHKADRGKKTKGTKEGHSGSAYPQRSHNMDTMYPHKKKHRLSMMAKDKKSGIKRPGGRSKFYGTEKKPIPEELQTENIAARLGASVLTQFAPNPNKDLVGKSLTAGMRVLGKKLRSGKPGDGYLFDPSLNIKNPFAPKPIIKDYPSEKEYKDSIKNQTSNQLSVVKLVLQTGVTVVRKRTFLIGNLSLSGRMGILQKRLKRTGRRQTVRIRLMV